MRCSWRWNYFASDLGGPRLILGMLSHYSDIVVARLQVELAFTRRISMKRTHAALATLFALPRRYFPVRRMRARQFHPPTTRPAVQPDRNGLGGGNRIDAMRICQFDGQHPGLSGAKCPGGSLRWRGGVRQPLAIYFGSGLSGRANSCRYL